MFNPLTAKFNNEDVLPLEVVSRWRDSQLQVGENYSNLTKLKGHAQVENHLKIGDFILD